MHPLIYLGIGAVALLGAFCLIVAELSETVERLADPEPGPLDGFRDPRPDEVPDGPAWRDHLTHTCGLDEESPRLRMPKRSGGPE
jgi:hypothetical protein